MICKTCLGKGWIINKDYTDRIECPACHGTKETNPTNEDWFCSLSTAEKAEFLDAIHTSYCVTGDWLHDEDVHGHGMKREDWELWLKQPHTSRGEK